MVKKEVGIRIQNIRKQLNYSKEKLGRKLGVTGQFISVVEKGESSLAYDKLEILCNISGYSSDFILFGKDNSEEINTKKLLKQYNEEQIQEACKIISKIAVFIKNDDVS